MGYRVDERYFARDTEGRLTIWILADQSVTVAKDIYDNDFTQIAISPDSQQLATIPFDTEEMRSLTQDASANGK